MRQIVYRIEHDEHGFYAFCPELPGCQTQGDTFAEAVINIHEAARFIWSRWKISHKERKEHKISKPLVLLAFFVARKFLVLHLGLCLPKFR